MNGPFLSVIVSAGLLAAALVWKGVGADHARAEAYHERVSGLTRDIELNPGEWLGQDVDLPPSATKLLRPNAIVARRYQTAERGGVSPTLLVVQCKDIRDMEGHYPPRCYPAHGWTLEAGPSSVGFGDLESAEYRFTRRFGRGSLEIVVCNLFILPDGTTTTDMRQVRKAGSDYQSRPFGAAQIQVVFDGTVSESDRAWALGQMRAIGAPLIDALLEGASEIRGESR